MGKEKLWRCGSKYGMIRQNDSQDAALLRGVVGLNPRELLKRYFGHSAFRARAGGADRQRTLWPGCFGRDAHRRREIHVLPDSGAFHERHDPGDLAADLSHGRSGGGPKSGGDSGSLPKFLSGFGGIPGRCSRGFGGTYRLVYVAPERLLVPGFLAAVSHTPIALVAVDEAHCVSQWGQDFRPSYLKIPEFLEQLPARPVLSAFTATATAEVKKDIIQMLGLRDPKVVTTGFDRPNLYFGVVRPRDKDAWLLEFIRGQAEKSGIVYCATRKNVETVCRSLQSQGFSAHPVPMRACRIRSGRKTKRTLSMTGFV